MSYEQDNGYVPESIADIIDSIRVGINTQFGTAYTEESFPGTGWYKFTYAIAQRVQTGEITTSEVFAKLQAYIATTNARIQRPAVSAPGILDVLDEAGYVASVDPVTDSNKGTIAICVDVDDTDPEYAATRLEICTIIKDSVSAGIESLGTEEETIVLTNGQSFDFKFYLPDRIPILLRLTVTISENNLFTVPDDETLRTLVFDNVNARYRLGLNFEPERYLTLEEAPWAATLLLEWSDDDGDNYYSTVFDSDFDELFEFGLEDIEIVGLT